MEIVALPEPQDVPALFDGADAPAERIERLVRAAFAIYERGAPELRVIRGEPEVHPHVAEAGKAVEAALTALVEAASGPSASRPRIARSFARWSTSAPGRRSATRASSPRRPSRP